MSSTAPSVANGKTSVETMSPANPSRFAGHKIIRRTGGTVQFDSSKIALAIAKAFEATKANGHKEKTLEQWQDSMEVKEVVSKVHDALWHKHLRDSATTHAIEEVQDQVELALLRSGHDDIASAYHQYREGHRKKRLEKVKSLIPETFNVRHKDGKTRLIEPSELHGRLESACHGLSELVSAEELMTRVVSSLHEGISEWNFARVPILEAATMIERHPDYSKVASRLLLDNLVVEVMDRPVTRGDMARLYPSHLGKMVMRGIKAKRLNPALPAKFDLQRLGAALRPERDDMLDYLGLQTLYDRYFIKEGELRIELPQSLWMRVAMGLALNEDNPTERAIEFYEVLSTFRFMSSTPTLFNSATTFSQMSSCYVTTVSDDLDGIFKSIKDNALLQKFAGGLGNDWTRVRAMKSPIKSTGGKSQGIIPFLRIANDTAVAVNQGGKRKGALCSYIETWHMDIEQFLELRKNTGDERRRTHDMNTANWIPDLFMERVRDKASWTLFSPSDVPDLHDLYGKNFKKAYLKYEKKFQDGKIPGRKVEAFDLWKKMISMLFETGHPWITFKDPCNVRSPQQHQGVVHSSNLCTEITLNTSDKEIAVCNLGSVNLSRHVGDDGKLDRDLIKDTVTTAVRMLDNVIDLNYYSVDKAKKSNHRHRPIGLGQAGYHDCLHKMGIGFDSDEAVEFADESTELIAYHAYWASSELAKERGSYESYEGSLWDRGILPLDSLRMLAAERHDGDVLPEADDGWIRVKGLEVNVESRLNWDALRDKIKRDGMRNSNCLAIAPTATISNIMGVSPCIEPTYKNLYTKSNLSGEFKVINPHLVEELIGLGIWDSAMVSQIIAHDGEIDSIERIPREVCERHKTCFRINQRWLVEAASRRQKWIDQSQSLNLYVSGMRGSEISDLYFFAWQRGLKTTYYCRSLQASSTEKYTTQETGQLNNVTVPTEKKESDKNESQVACSLDDPDCEACQ